ncbi:hypothetical protein [Streptomyces sp. NPDC059455]|uniref:hypothetical protein n=1 Tax=Streptomyces sp. NPDC059455 TaxID=3346837 RepID=UPI0036ABAD55
MTRYGFAIKALPAGSKVPGDDEDDENEQTAATRSPSGKASIEGVNPNTPDSESSEDLPDDLPENPAVETNSAAAEDLEQPPVADATPDGESGNEDPGEVPAQADDARPWAGDMYDEGDETDPEDAYCAYVGSAGEQAWLDRAPDGTLTGWVRDTTGQVWRYTSPDAWATDVDGAQMSRTHGPEGGDDTTVPETASAPVQAEGRGAQDPLFASQ